MASRHTHELGQLIRNTRRRLGLTIEELADRAGVARSTVGELEQGRRDSPLPATLRAIGDVLHIPAEVMAIGNGDPPREAVLNQLAEAANATSTKALYRAVIPLLLVLAHEAPAVDPPEVLLGVVGLPDKESPPDPKVEGGS